MSRTTLKQDGDLQLELVTPDDQEFPFRFETICVRCLAVVASSTYTEADEDDAAIEARIEHDAERDLRVGLVHQQTCGIG